MKQEIKQQELMNNLEMNKIYCESNLETMQKMPNNFVDYVLTSPPYNVSTERIAKYKDFKDSFTFLCFSI